MNKKELISIIDKFSGTPMFVLGDLIVDHYIWGSVDRISPEAPVVVVQVNDENLCLGGAGNVVHNLRSLGAEVSVTGVVGDDEAGRELTGIFSDLGVNTEAVLRDQTRPTTKKSRVIAHAQQVVRVDRENSDAFPLEVQAKLADHLASALDKSAGVIISDYAKGVVSAPIFKVIEDGYKKGKLGVDKTAVLLDPKAPNFPLYTRSTVVKPNRLEAEQAVGAKIRTKADGIAAGMELRKKWSAEQVLITLGELGMVLVPSDDPKEVVEVDTAAREVYDVSGAGDTVSAVFSLAMAVGASSQAAAVLSNYAAGIVIGEVGTVAVSADSLRKTIEEERSE